MPRSLHKDARKGAPRGNQGKFQRKLGKLKRQGSNKCEELREHHGQMAKGKPNSNASPQKGTGPQNTGRKKLAHPLQAPRHPSPWAQEFTPHPRAILSPQGRDEAGQPTQQASPKAPKTPGTATMNGKWGSSRRSQEMQAKRQAKTTRRLG